MVRHLVDNLKLEGDVNRVAQLLLDRGADPELLDAEGGMTPTMYGKENFNNAVTK